MQTVTEFLNQWSATEGHDCSDYNVTIDTGTAAFVPVLDELFVEYNHAVREAIIRRRRILINPMRESE